MAKKRKVMKKKVTKKKASKKKVAKKAAKKSTKKKNRIVKKAQAPKKVAPEMMAQLHEHSDGHNEPTDNPISEISDNGPEHGLKEQSTDETDDLGAENDTEN